MDEIITFYFSILTASAVVGAGLCAGSSLIGMTIGGLLKLLRESVK